MGESSWSITVRKSGTDGFHHTLTATTQKPTVTWIIGRKKPDIRANPTHTNSHQHPLHRHVPVIVNTPEARKDVSEAGVAVKFGLALGAFYRALQSPT